MKLIEIEGRWFNPDEVCIVREIEAEGRSVVEVVTSGGPQWLPGTPIDRVVQALESTRE